MRSIPLKLLIKNTIIYYAVLFFIVLLLFGCSSSKKIKQKTYLVGTEKNTTKEPSSNSNTSSTLNDYDFDNHEYISLKPEQTTTFSSGITDSIEQVKTSRAEGETELPVSVYKMSPVANKIVENYIQSENKEPKGHCLAVSKGRFEKAYKEVHGHSLYQDLPKSMATNTNTSKQVFNLLYVSASDTKAAWRSLPEIYRGKGNAGAIAYAGMGTLVDTEGIWSGQLIPGALMQVWRFKDDFEKVVQGVDVKKLDPYGHSFIFISYDRNEENEIVGLRIADQGFQSYRPLVPRDYEVWWGVNLSI